MKILFICTSYLGVEHEQVILKHGVVEDLSLWLDTNGLIIAHTVALNLQVQVVVFCVPSII